MILIKREMNLADIETLYEKYKDESVSTAIDIVLPNDFKEETIGVLSSLLQFIITVIRDGKLNAIKTRIKDASEIDNLLTSAKSYLWYVSSCLQWLNKFTYENGDSLKSDIRPVNQGINELMRNYRPLGTSFMLTCFDHLPKNVGLLRMFYQPPSYLIVDEDMIEQYVNQIVKNIGEKTNKAVLGQLQNLLKPLSEIVYELFKNTDDWATKDRFGNKVEPSVRGVYFRYYKNFQRSMAHYAQSNSSLNRYFLNPIFKQDSENKISFIEISVFDSGDGFVGRRLGTLYDNETSIIEDEVKIVKQCLTKYWTNEEGRKAVVKGKGLDKVLNTIDKKGFLRIRTNKVHVFRDMIIDHYQTESISDNIKLYDWETLSENDFTANYNSKGSVITIILPLDAVSFIINK